MTTEAPVKHEATLLIDGEELSVNVIRLQPGDKILLSCSRRVTADWITRIKEAAEAFFKGHEVVIVTDEIRLDVARGEQQSRS